jgi:hypothetical protein
MRCQLLFPVVLIALLIASCGSPGTPVPAIPVKSDLYDTLLHDTVFLERHLTNDYYHAVYVETDTASEKFRELLTPLKPDSEEIMAAYQSASDGKYYSKKVKMNGLPSNWLPVHQYNGKLHLYFPPDLSTINKTTITDSLFVSLSFDYTLMPLEDIQKVDENTYDVRVIPPVYNQQLNRLIIHIIDPVTQLAVWEYPGQDASLRYGLYIPVKKAHLLPLISHVTSGEKPRTFERFDRIDYGKLLKETKN